MTNSTIGKRIRLTFTHDRYTSIFSKILVAIDGSKQSMDAAYYAINVSNKFNAELYAIYVTKDPAYVEMFSFGIYGTETPIHSFIFYCNHY
jgi:K+-sensing histidine kinase KdpD